MTVDVMETETEDGCIGDDLSASVIESQRIALHAL